MRIAALHAMTLLAASATSGEPPSKPAALVDNHGVPLPEGAIQRYGTVRFRGGGALRRACMSADGKYIAAAADCVVLVWERTTGRLIRRFQVNDFSFDALSFSRDSREITAANMACDDWRWELASGRPVAQ